MTAFSSTDLIGKGLIWVPILGGIQTVTYHAPRFNNNILAVCELSTHVNVLFPDTFMPYKGCFLLQSHMHALLFETKCSNGLYKLPLHNSNGNTNHISLAAVTNRSVAADAKRWHDMTGHISSKRYDQLSKLIWTVPSFHPSIMKSIECITCITAKARQAPVRTAATQVEFPVEQINVDISGPFIPTITGERYAFHFLDSRTAKSDVHLLMTKA